MATSPNLSRERTHYFTNALWAEIREKATAFANNPSMRTWMNFKRYVKIQTNQNATLNNLRRYANFVNNAPELAALKLYKNAMNAAQRFANNPSDNTWREFKAAHALRGPRYSVITNNNIRNYISKNNTNQSWRRVAAAAKNRKAPMARFWSAFKKV
jgi:hypothetical protein